MFKPLGTNEYKWKSSFDIVKPLGTNEYTLKGSFNFVNKLRDLRLQNDSMLSFDVDSLVTNVPVLETIDLVLECRASTYFH